ncbi:MAG: AgmX/PglI C-terminal domain-containing protein [Deltaproteobacteria bacterium]|nr:AgmX/PglI C-terminal domain-containing protein [Deltaproteobacteria bacterium]
MGLALRASLIWHDEVMQDVVCERREPVTLGASGATTFVVPDVGLPDDFAILRAVSRGYVLTLGARMRGTLCLGGATVAVEELVHGEAFRATPLEVADWGVIELDESGAHKLFFQFVPVEDPVPVVTRGMLIAGAVGWGAGSLVLTGLWLGKGLGVGEALFRGAGLVSLALGGALLLHNLLKHDNESRASLVFSMVLHAAFLFMTFQVYSHHAAYAWPQERTANVSYVVARLDQRVDPTAMIVVTSKIPVVSEQRPAPPIPNAMPSTRIAVPQPARRPAVARRPEVPGLPSTVLDEIAGRDVARIKKRIGATGPRTDGPLQPQFPFKTVADGDGGAPTPEQPKKTAELEIKVRPPVKVCVGEGEGCDGAGPVTVTPTKTSDDDGPEMTEHEIKTALRARSGVFRMCFQQEVNRLGETRGGSVVVQFRIGPDGYVASSRKAAGTMASADVTACVLRNVNAVRFPAKRGSTNVTFPFVFNL